MSDTPRVVFFQVPDATAKLNRIAEIAQYHFIRKEHLLILAEEDKALAFADELLWKHPPDSFLPHSIQEAESKEWIVLTKIKKNLNDARYVFNLCPTPLLIEGPFRIIYDFEDTREPNKKMLSQIRFDAYKQAQFLIESRI
jgi:DNA polymerase IIIc chi subunit